MSRARELARLGNENVLSADDTNNRLGIGSEIPTRDIDIGGHGVFSGIMSVTNTTNASSTTTGSVIISGGVGIAKSLFVGEGVSIAGTITYNDVTNIDSIGFVTAGKGLRSTTGGLIVTAGVSTFGADIGGKDGVQGLNVATALKVAGVSTFVGLVTCADVVSSGIITADSYYGDGSNLSNITSTTINNNADNRLITGSGTANTLEGEANLTFDGEDLVLKSGGEIRADAPDGGARFKVGWTENDEDPFLDLHDTNDVRQIHLDSDDAADNVSFIRRGRLGINTDTNVNHPLKIDCNGTSGQDVWALHLNNTAGDARGRAGIVMGGQGNTNAYFGSIYGGPNNDNSGHGDLVFKCPDNSGTNNTMLFLHGKSYSDGKIQATPGGGGFQILGALSKSSGSFRIPHPLSGLSTTKDLVHSFIEGPQADLIYRGVSTLSSGTSSVNIDTEFKMTQGTFGALVDNVSCFTSNETDWKAVKGSVSGNVLTISCEDTNSTAKVSWLVIGERCDAHMISTETVWTDDNGRVITEVDQEPPLE